MSFITLDFPREVLELNSDGNKGFRRLVKNSDELESYWRGKNGSGNVYFTAYGYRSLTPPRNHRVDYNTPIIRHFVCDFDCKNFRKKGEDVPFDEMQEQVRALHTHLKSNNKIHYIWFSGGGFHFWIPLSKTHTPSTGYDVAMVKEAGRVLLSDWHKKLDLYCNDPTVAFDTAGMIRIPNSYNSRRGCWTIPLTSHEVMTCDYDDLIEMAQESRSGFIKHGTEAIKLQIRKRAKKFKGKEYKNIDLPELAIDNMIILPCLAQSAMGGGNPTHKARVHFASYLAGRLRWFFPPDYPSLEEKQGHVNQIVDIIEAQEWVDFNPSVTRHQVRSIVMGSGGNNGYIPATCRTLIHDGICTGRCRYYDGTAEDD
tara:strand:- start:4 stop:1110 length:1107 start_codon:yes stop_codon:yes gene_type:complete